VQGLLISLYAQNFPTYFLWVFYAYKFLKFSFFKIIVFPIEILSTEYNTSATLETDLRLERLPNIPQSDTQALRRLTFTAPHRASGKKNYV
jgi:hypothetical protein